MAEDAPESPRAISPRSGPIEGRKGNLYFHVMEARRLLGKDSGGVSDPYVNVYLDSKKIQKTQIIVKTTDPKWKEKSPLVELTESEGYKEIAFRLWDYDRFKWDEFLGEARIQLEELYDRIPRDEWLPLGPRKGKKEKVDGELHVQLLFLAPGDKMSDTMDEFRYPLQMLQKQGKEEPFSVLVKRTNDIEREDGEGEHATHVACVLDKPAFLKLLLDHKANKNAANSQDGATPVHRAAVHSMACLKLLQENGADLNAKDKNGNTPLHYAANNDCKEAIQFLIAQGVSPNVVNANGDTPLHTALENKKNREAIKTLIDSNADIFLANKDGKSAADLVFNKQKVNEFNRHAFVDTLKISNAYELEPRKDLKNRYSFDGDGANFDWQESSQYALKFSEAGKACTLLHIPFDVAKGADANELLAYIVVRTPEGNHNVPSYQTELVGHGKGAIPLFFDVDPSMHYAVIPHALVQESSGMRFEFIAYSNSEMSHKSLVPYKEHVSIKGHWKKGESAGGCKTEQTFSQNPRYLLTLPKGDSPVHMAVLIAQARGTMDAIYKNTIRVVTHENYIGFTFMDEKGKEVLDEFNEYPELVVKFKNATENYLFVKMDTSTNNRYVIVPSTFKPDQETLFELKVLSDVKVTLEPFTV